MSEESRLLTPPQAEAVIDGLIEQFGLGALPRVVVDELPDGRWHVRWDHQQCTVAPMGAEAWTAWLEEHVGSLDAGDLETTES